MLIEAEPRNRGLVFLLKSLRKQTLILIKCGAFRYFCLSDPLENDIGLRLSKISLVLGLTGIENDSNFYD